MKYFITKAGLEPILCDWRRLYEQMFTTESTYCGSAHKVMTELLELPNVVFLRPNVSVGDIERFFPDGKIMKYPFLSLGLMETDLLQGKYGIVIHQFFTEGDAFYPQVNMVLIKKEYIGFLERVFTIDEMLVSLETC